MKTTALILFLFVLSALSTHAQRPNKPDFSAMDVDVQKSKQRISFYDSDLEYMPPLLLI